MTQYEVNNCSIDSILSSIKSNTMAIPEIQRPFVWDSTKVRDLIDSLEIKLLTGRKKAAQGLFITLFHL